MMSVHEDAQSGATERLEVLRLLEQGKITAAEAAQLLEALSAARPGVRRRHGAAQGDGPGRSAEEALRRAGRRARGAATFWAQHADELTSKALEQASRTVEQVGETIGRVFAGVPDLAERAAQVNWGNKGIGFHFDDEAEGRLEGDVQGPAGVDVKGWNGAVLVHGVDGDRCRVVLHKTVYALSESAARDIAQSAHGSVVSRQVEVRRESDGRSWTGALSTEAFLPRSAAWGGVLSTSNGPLSVEDLCVDGLQLETTNGPVRGTDLHGGSLQAVSANGRINISGALHRLEAHTTNGSIHLHPDPLEGEAEVVAATSNGSIELHLPPDTAVKLVAVTSNGRVDAEVLVGGAGKPGGFGRNEVHWQDPQWDTAVRRLSLRLRTSNGSIRLL
jgi:hypothetical protein